MKMKYINNICRAALMLVVVSMASCSNDELNSEDLKVYVNAGLNNEVELPFLRTPKEMLGKTTTAFYLQSTRELQADAEVTLTTDETLVGAYNEAHKTAFKPLPQGLYTLTPNVTIKKGTMVSEQQVQIELTDPTKLREESGYLLPVRMENVVSHDHGVELSANLNTVYLIVTSTYTNVIESNTQPTGTLIDKKGWKATSSSEQYGYLISDAIDNNTSTFWIGDKTAILTFDMGVEQPLNGIRITPDHALFGTAYYATKVEIAISQDGEAWKVLGSANLSRPDVTKSVKNPDYKYIQFYAPEKARYFRIRILAAESYGTMSEVDAYKL